MKLGAGIVWMMLLISAAPPSSCASHGGPEDVAILGFDPVDEKIFFVTWYRNEAGNGPDVFYFHLKGRRPSVPVRVDLLGSIKGLEGSAEERRSKAIRNLAARLRPLPHPRDLSLELRVQELSADSIAERDWKVSRRVQSVELRDSSSSARVELATFCDHRIGIHSIHRLPGQSWSVVTLTYTGIPRETCYDLQSPILLLPGGTPPRKVGSTDPDLPYTRHPAAQSP